MSDTRHDHAVCPWWQAYFFDNALRHLLHSPKKLFADYLSEGMTAVDIGCGMGFFSIAMAKTVNEPGKIVAVDLQPKMLTVLRRRAERAGVDSIIDTRQCAEESIGLPISADFVLLFWSMHEIPDSRRLSREIVDMLKPGGACFVAEPAFHVSATTLSAQIKALREAGLMEISRPKVAFSRAAVLRKPEAVKK